MQASKAEKQNGTVLLGILCGAAGDLITMVYVYSHTGPQKKSHFKPESNCVSVFFSHYKCNTELNLADNQNMMPFS